MPTTREAVGVDERRWQRRVQGSAGINPAQKLDRSSHSASLFLWIQTAQKTRKKDMNESSVIPSTGSLNMETSSLLSITQRQDAGVLSGDRVFTRNNTALGFLLGGLCLGIFGFLLLMFAVFTKRINTQRLTVFKISLIFTGLLQSLSTPAVAVLLTGSYCSLKYCYKLLMVWFASRRCGLLLHLLVALEFVATNQSGGGAKVVPLYWSLPIVLTLDLICILFFEVFEAAVALGTVAMALTFVISGFGAYRSSTIGKKLLNQVVGLACQSFFAIYFPSFVMECMILNKVFVVGWTYDILLCLTNVRLITDACLCWVTCKETPEEAPQEPQVRQVNPDQSD